MKIEQWIGIIAVMASVGCGSSKNSDNDTSWKSESRALSANEKTRNECNKSGYPFGGGTGEEGNPYLICSVSQLENMANSSDPFYYLLTTDIDMTNEKHTCIGVAITGVFDGGGHGINNFNSDLSMGQENGMLFCQLFTAHSIVAEIKNLNINNLNIHSKSEYYTAGLVGSNTRDKITNVHVTGKIAGGRNVGGLVAQNFGTIRDSSFDGTITGTSNIGGIAGRAQDFSIDNCRVSGSVSGDSSIGGIVGEGDEKLTLYGNEVTAQISGNLDFGSLIGRRSH